MKTRQLCSAALLAALTAVCSQLTIPTPWQVPISMSTFAVFLSGALLGAKWGTAAQGVYLLLGLVGVPVFSGMPGRRAGARRTDRRVFDRVSGGLRR